MSDYFNLNEGVEKTEKRFRKLNLRFKFNKKIVFTALIVLAIPITVILSQQTQDIRKHAAENEVPQTASSETLPPKGYIVEFKSPPASSAVSGSIKTASKAVQQSTFQTAKANLLIEHQSAKIDILTRLGKTSFDSIKPKAGDGKVVILSEFTNSFNGIAIDVDSSQIEAIKSSPYVKAVHPNNSVKTNLMDSVPLIGADKVWQNIKDANGNPVTGKGVNIAVIDTGVDYTHPDLGNTNMPERPFEKINTDPLLNWVSSFEDQQISYDNNRLAYTSKQEEISIYSFTDHNTTKIALNSGMINAGVFTIFLKDQNLFYTAISNEGEALFYKNLITGEQKKISDLTPVDGYSFMPRLSFWNGKLIYEKNNGNRDPRNGSSIQSIYAYDLATGIESVIINGVNFYSMMPRVFGDRMVFTRLNLSDNKIHAFVYDLLTSQEREINTPETNRISDFKDNWIFYLQNYGNYYYLYNIDTGESKKISPNFENANGLLNFGDSATAQSFGVSLVHLSPALIGDGVVVFRDPQGVRTLDIYDQNKDKYYKLNLKIPSGSLVLNGKKICFAENIPSAVIRGYNDVYCLDYDPNGNYDLPSTIYNSKVVSGYNFIRNNNDALDDFMHGTHVAEIAAGNGTLKGVAPDANIIAYKVLDWNGMGYFSTIILAIDQAIATRNDSDPTNDINVINLSLGATCTSYTTDCGPDDPLSRAVNVAVGNGIFVAVAAGNGGRQNALIGTPGTASRSATVGAVDKQRIITDFSSRGPVIWNGEDLKKPDVVAPGVYICSAEVFGLYYPESKCYDGWHIKLSGTSMATPHVAGLAALILQAHPDWTPQQVKDAIKNNADDLGYDYNTQGAGMIDAAKLFGLSSTPTPTPSLTPTPSPTPTPTPTPSPVPVQTLILTPKADAFVRSSTPTTNFGLLSYLQTDSNPNTISYLKFNLVPLAGKTIKSAKLVLKVSNPTNSTLTLKRSGNTSWTETGITYNSKPGFEATIRTFSANTLNATINLPVKSAVDLKKGRAITFGITSGANDSGAFYSRESASSNRPQLIVEYQ